MTATTPGTDAVARLGGLDYGAERARLLAGTRGPPAIHHLNSAGASLSSGEVIRTIVEHLRLEADIGGYEAAASVLPRLEAVYVAAAALIGAHPTEIALTESATVGWRRFVDSLRLEPGDRVLATRSTYVSSALHLLELERSGVIVELLGTDDAGRTDPAAVERALSAKAALLVATHVPTSSGMVEPVHELGALTAHAGVPYLVDATQSVGQLPLDVGAVQCSALVTTGRKFLRGPRGTGFLYVKGELCTSLRPVAPDVRGARWLDERSFELSGTARRFESWEAAHALRLGLGVALAESAAIGVEQVRDHVVGLARFLRERLIEEVAGIRITDPGDAASGIVTFVRDGEDPAQTLGRLTRAGCHVVTVPAAHGVWDLSPRGLSAVLRASFHVYNGEDDVQAVIEALRVADRRPVPARVADPRPGPSASAVAASAERHNADVIVIGAGIHGRSAAWRLAARGASVILLEQFRPGHVAGSSHGDSRMIRRAYPSPVWDQLLDRAYATWAELEASAGTPLVTVTGGLYAHPAGEAGALNGPGCEEIDVRTAATIAPALALEEGYTVVHDPRAGVIDAAGAMDALARLGAAAGVVMYDSSPVLALRDDEGGVTVTTPGGTLRAGSAVVCAGPWTAQLLPELAGSLKVLRIVNVHLSSEDPAAVAAPELGVFAVQVPDAGLFYGIPGIGGRGLKVGLDDGPPDDPRLPPAPVAAHEIEALRLLVRRFLPAGDGPPEEAIACRYTRTPTQRFAVGPLPDRPRVLVAAACSGHGFKFGPAIGEALADLVAGVARPDLDFLAPAALLAVV